MNQETIIIYNRNEAVYREYKDLVLISLKGSLYEFEDTGAVIVKMIINRSLSIDEMVKAVAAKYSIPAADIIDDTQEFLDQLLQNRIIYLYLDNNRTNPEYPQKNKRESNSNCHYSFWEYAKKNLIPVKCKLNLTFRCNLKCRFCYNGDRVDKRNSFLASYNKELSTPEIKDILEQIAEEGTFFLTLTGGEPLIRRDIDEILTITDELNFSVEILTNGTLINEDYIKILTKHKIQKIVIPIFGYTPRTHDAFVQATGSHEKALRGIKALIAAGIPTAMRCAITQLNFKEWKQIRDLATELKAEYLPYIQIHKSCDHLDMRAIRLNDNQIRTLFESGLSLNEDYECLVSFARFDIFPNGNVTLCSLLDKSLGNLREEPFSAIWHDSQELNSIREKLKNRQPDEVESDKIYRCSADALYDHGDLAATSQVAKKIIKIADEVSEAVKQSQNPDFSQIVINHNNLSMRKYEDCWFIHTYNTDNYFQLDESFAVLWDILNRERDYTQVLNSFMACFPQNPQTVRQDFPELISVLKEMQLISNGKTQISNPEPVLKIKENADTDLTDSSCPVQENMVHIARKENFPLLAEFELTHNCNLKCKHCYLSENAPPPGEDMPAEKITREDIPALINDLVNSGIYYLILSGGECTISPFFQLTITEARKRNLDITILSNGTMLNEELIKFLKSHGISKIVISIYGNTDQEYEQFCGIKNGFRLVKSNLIKMKEAGLPVTAKIMLTSFQQSTVYQTISILEELQIPFSINTFLMPGTNGNLVPLQYKVNDIVKKKLIMDGYLPVQEECKICTAASLKFRIAPDGSVYPCELFREKLGKLPDQKILDILRNEKNKNIIADIMRKSRQILKDKEIKGCPVVEASIYTLENRKQKSEAGYF